MVRASSRIDRRTVLRAIGGSGLLGVAASTASAGSLSVATRDATKVWDNTATLNGELLDLGGADSADVYFEYWIADGEEPCGADDGSVHVTEPQTLSAPGEFSERVGFLCENTGYVFRAVAEADGTRVTGDEKFFRTVIL